jgi:16S rRNA processing protein RimM
VRTGDTGIKKVTVGLVLKAVGLKGELRIKPLTDNPERYAVGGKVWMSLPEGEDRAFTVKAAREYKGNLTVSFAEVASIEEAEICRGRELFVPATDVPPLPEGEYYHFQILGLPVYNQSGKLLGKVSDIFTAGEKDVYVVTGQGKEYLVPVNDDTVETIDVEAGKIVIFPMPGYIEE